MVRRHTPHLQFDTTAAYTLPSPHTVFFSGPTSSACHAAAGQAVVNKAQMACGTGRWWSFEVGAWTLASLLIGFVRL